MTEQTNAELIAEARDFVQMGSGINVMEADRLIEELARELEAADQRAKNAEQRADDAREEVGYEKRMREFVSGERDRFIDLKRDAERDRDLFKREQVRLAARCDQAQNERDALAAVVEQVRAARSDHPACEKHPEREPVSCGWKRAVLDIDAALATAPEKGERDGR